MEAHTLAGDVRSRRLAAGLSQLDLAQRAGCSWSTIRLFDRGYEPAHSETLARVLAVLDAAQAYPRDGRPAA
jgi:transcriptional regulator with XRE-family HTH domain